MERLSFHPERRLISAFTAIDLSEVTLSCGSQRADLSPTKLLVRSACPVCCRTAQLEWQSKSTKSTKQTSPWRRTIKGVND